MTIWEVIKNDWTIKKRDLVEMGINPNKQWDEITYRELSILAEFLDVLVADLV